MAKSDRALPFFVSYLQPMSTLLPLKKALVAQLSELLESRKSGLETALSAAKESRDNDTKSSAGDKFETGRAMMQQEMDKLEQQLHQLHQQLHQLRAIDCQATHKQAGQGSLLQTDTNTYFLAIAFGKLELDHQNIWVISTASPIAQSMLGKKAGESFSFQQQQSRIINLG